MTPPNGGNDLEAGHPGLLIKACQEENSSSDGPGLLPKTGHDEKIPLGWFSSWPAFGSNPEPSDKPFSS